MRTLFAPDNPAKTTQLIPIRVVVTTKFCLTAQNVAFEERGTASVNADTRLDVSPGQVGVCGGAEKIAQREGKPFAGRLWCRIGNGAFKRDRFGPLWAASTAGHAGRRGLLGGGR
ncbi:hypothetical protein GobsT_32300 [Gemmata obscuriglobus]|uniref:Uncharacterized protein n=1 Tax=Gemmata obscuriglobus TaxID=114 RepID=A0A2Z3H2P3_9BACT|nr:hypothetical protein [Gemmata obscuriglobus]AWM38592.1 hypothetical protein C1280_17455 [Gemmata obscuriglobus]QEG28451.1 hypothetical protein GobsT_32300 [Gemmata obscuriglobus]VTS06440.1 unnamed protein product [Gemmata obscuriglobus UQM 2246]